jgi:CDP-paratose 2-epimerase
MRNMLITGGAGFIGSNAARRFARQGWQISVLDDCSRSGAAENLQILRREIPMHFFAGDVRNPADVEAAFGARRVDAVLHLSAQVAVTTSVVDPVTDFQINALGTLNVLEAARRHAPAAAFIYSSTNKVYGSLARRRVECAGRRYVLADAPAGIAEDQPLDFHSPYGCSKGAADQYVADYARIYGLRTFVIRQSCIYGPWQYGIEDQGWVAWFAIAALLGRTVTVFGDGRQTRDLLWVDDLVDLYSRCIDSNLECGTYNAGGGPACCASVLEVIELLGGALGRPIPYGWGDWRPGDQKVYVSDTGKAWRDLGWRPATTVQAGLEKLVGWIQDHRELLERAFQPAASPKAAAARSLCAS